MKATGIIRRVDDLGRVVIPKEIRRTLRIREGDPLELFTEGNAVCFMKYHKFNQAQWDLASKIISPIVTNYAILDGYGDAVKCNGIKVSNVEEARTRDDVVIEHIQCLGDSTAYLIARNDSDTEKIKLAAAVLKKFLDEDEE